MATKKITDLTELTATASAATDVLPIVDISEDVTKKITLTSIKSGSFSGSFSGDGSGLTGVVSASYAASASYEIVKEVSSSYADVAGDLTGQPSILVTNITSSGDISSSGAYYGDGSNLTGISAGFWTGSNGTITRYSDVEITGSTKIRLSASRDDFKININGLGGGLGNPPFSATIMKVSASKVVGMSTEITPHIIFGRDSSELQNLDFDLSDRVTFRGPSSHTQRWISSSLVPYASMNLGASSYPWNYVYANTGSISLQPTASITILNWSDMHSCYSNVDGVTDGGEFIMDESHVFNPLVLKGNVTASLPGLNTGSAGYESFRSKGVTYWLINGNTDGTPLMVKPSGSSAPDLWLGTFMEDMATPANYTYSDGEEGAGGVFGNYIKISSFTSNTTTNNSSGDVFWTILEKRGNWVVVEEE